MITHIAAITLTFFIYMLLGLSYLGWGRIASLALGLNKNKPESPMMPVWLGWASTLLVFQALHLFMPITAYVTLPVLAVGLMFSISPVRAVIQRYQKKQLSHFVLIISLMAFIAVAFLIASKAMLPPTFYDTGLYHLNAIRWINSYPIVPGLGNLHGRLAFNQSFFTYIAALNFYPFFGHGRSLANSFLLLLFLATILSSMCPVIKRPWVLFEEHPFKYAAVLFMLPIFVYLMLLPFGITEPTPDYASKLLQLVMFVMFVHGITLWMAGERNQSYQAAVLAVLAVTAVTVKLSNLAFSAVMICFVAAYQWQTWQEQMKCHLRLLCFTILLIFIWLLRGFILSGAPLYPSTIGYIPVGWAVPVDKIIEEANWVYSFARRPHVPWQDVLGSWAWLKPWFHVVLKDNTNIFYPSVFAILLCVITLALRHLKIMRGPRALEWVILLPSAIGLIYWFATAPDPRFANAIFFLAMISAMLLFLVAIKSIATRRVYIILLCIVFFGCNADIFSYILRNVSDLKSISTTGWQPVQQVPLQEKTTLSGLIVYTPINPGIDDRCWDSPLPSTPYFNERLRLRRSTDLSSGFTVLPDTKDYAEIKK